MARLAATEFGADWVLDADADEFWLARGASLKELLAVVPSRFGAVRGAWRTRAAPHDERFFADRITARLCTPSSIPTRSAPIPSPPTAPAPTSALGAAITRRSPTTWSRCEGGIRRDTPLPGQVVGAVPPEVRDPVRRARAERGEGDPGAHGRGV